MPSMGGPPVNMYKYKIGEFVYYASDKDKTLHRIRKHEYDNDNKRWVYKIINVYEREKDPEGWVQEGKLKSRTMANWLPIQLPFEERWESVER